MDLKLMALGLLLIAFGVHLGYESWQSMRNVLTKMGYEPSIGGLFKKMADDLDDR